MSDTGNYPQKSFIKILSNEASASPGEFCDTGNSKEMPEPLPVPAFLYIFILLRDNISYFFISLRDDNPLFLHITQRFYSLLLYSVTLSRCQISSTYCWMVRSEVNFPLHAVFSIAILAHLSSSLYASSTLF